MKTKDAMEDATENLTNMVAGAKYFQHRIQNMLGLTPVICSTQSLNLEQGSGEITPQTEGQYRLPFRTKHPANDHSLEEADPEKSHARAGVEVHNLEEIHTAFWAHGHTQTEQ